MNMHPSSAKRRLLPLLIGSLVALVAAACLTVSAGTASGSDRADSYAEETEKRTATVTFVADHKVLAVETYVVGETESVPEPEIPQNYSHNAFVNYGLAFYRLVWPEYELNGEDITVTARYAVIRYTAHYLVDGVPYATRSYNMENKNWNIPTVPARDGWVGTWQMTELDGTDITLEAVYEDSVSAHKNHITATFEGLRYDVTCRTLATGLYPEQNLYRYYTMGVPTYAGLIHVGENYYFIASDGWCVADCYYTIDALGANGLLPPGTYRFNEKGEMVFEEHTVRFMADGKEVAVRTYKDGAPFVEEPEVPHKLGHSGAWEPYALNGSDVVVNAVYSFNYYVPDERAANSYIDPARSFELQTVYKKWTVAEIYAAWDDLGARFPQYVTKTVADYKDASGIYDLVRYVLEPEDGYEKTVYFQAGADASEHAAQMAALRIAQILCADDGSDEIIHYLRTKVRFVIIPLANPYGLGGSDGKGTGATTLCTYTGIRMNRNFDGAWSLVNVTHASPMNSGAAPFHGHTYDENGELVIVPETWWVKETIEWIGVDNLHYGFDFHDAGNVESFGDYWMNFSTFHRRQAWNVQELIQYLCTVHLIENPNLWHCTDSLTSGTFANWMTKTLGVPGGTVESCYTGATFDQTFMNNILETYFNAVMVHTLEDYRRPLDIDDTAEDFKLDWYAALGEQYFNWRTTNPYNTDAHMVEAFNKMVEAGLLTATPFSTAKSSLTGYYYTYEPEGWSKTVVLYGGYTKTGNTIRPVNGLFYKLLLLATGGYENEHLETLGSEYRIVIIPYLDASPSVSNDYYPERFGQLLTGSAAWKTLNGILDTVRADGEIDLFLYYWNISAPNKTSSVSWEDYVNKTLPTRYGADASDMTTERWVCAGEISDDVRALTERLSYGSHVRYETADSSGRIADELVRNGTVRKAVCVESTIDLAEYKRVMNDFPVSTGGSSGKDPITAIAFESLNSETARRLNALINLIETMS